MKKVTKPTVTGSKFVGQSLGLNPAPSLQAPKSGDVVGGVPPIKGGGGKGMPKAKKPAKKKMY
jgi:hypothetical protein